MPSEKNKHDIFGVGMISNVPRCRAKQSGLSAQSAQMKAQYQGQLYSMIFRLDWCCEQLKLKDLP